jgi:hypothetical protein
MPPPHARQEAQDIMTRRTSWLAPWARLDAAFGRERWLMTALAAAAAVVFAVYVMVLAEAVHRGEARAHPQAPATAELQNDRRTAVDPHYERNPA